MHAPGTTVTTFLLVRHATCDPVGRSLAGRAPGVALNDAGRAEAERLAGRLAGVRVAAIYTSPLDRARETAAAIAARTGAPVRPHEPFGEFDFGEWTGRTFAELAPDPRWRRFNTFRSGTRVPGGELMLEAQARAVAAVHSLAAAHAGETVLVVSHADVIKAVVAYFAGIPLDLTHRLEVGPASVSALALDEEGARVLGLNDTGAYAPAAST